MTELTNLPPPIQLRVFVFDIETAPMLAKVWSPKQRWIGSDAIDTEPFLLTWAGKWLGQSTVYSDRLNPDEARHQNDERIVLSLADKLRVADYVIAHNGDRFDIPRVNARVCELGLEPLGPVHSIDTLKLSRQSFGWPHHDLNSIAKRLLGDEKIHVDFAVWRDCMAGDDKALRAMERYNKKDVVLLERVFEAMKPYVKRLPGTWDAGWAGQLCCPHCGSLDLMIRGYARTKINRYVRFQCKECKRYTRGRSPNETGKSKTVPV